MDKMKVTALFMIMMLLCACSSEDLIDGGQESGTDNAETVVEDGIVDFDVLDSYMSSTSDITFERDDMKWYRMDAFTNGEWEEFDWWTVLGGGFVTDFPSYFVMHNGQIWELYVNPNMPMRYPYELSLPMMAYEAVTGKTVNLYIKKDFDVDREADDVRLIGAVWPTVRLIVHLDSEFLVLSMETTYTGGRTGTGGLHKGVASYKISENPIELDSDVDFGFVDEWSLCEWCIALLRETFGDEIDMTEIPGIAYGSEPIINIDILELDLMCRCGKITDDEYAEALRQLLGID